VLESRRFLTEKEERRRSTKQDQNEKLEIKNGDETQRKKKRNGVEKRYALIPC